ncbi:MAG: alpha/beta fold hydrolase, partial [Acidobacteriaceae bacterium]|nr:alpha/beta fold hydrolase [Acidobacteriaceae bacterium]
VILESNWGAPGFSWVYIHKQIAKFTRACWYDRAGYGWSAPGPFPNHSDTIARDLHKLLQASGTRRPYVLVGHAMGAFHVRVFRGYYPSEVAGLVFVDPMSEDLTIHIHNHIEAFRPTVLFIDQLMGGLGLLRLASRNSGPVPSASGLSVREWATVAALRLQTKSLVATGKEPPLWIGGELARASGGFGNVPVVVLSAGIQDQEEDPELDQHHDFKMTLHAKLAGLSKRGKQVIVNSGHQMPWTAPNAVVSAVTEVVTEVRNGTLNRGSAEKD